MDESNFSMGNATMVKLSARSRFRRILGGGLTLYFLFISFSTTIYASDNSAIILAKYRNILMNGTFQEKKTAVRELLSDDEGKRILTAIYKEFGEDANIIIEYSDFVIRNLDCSGLDTHGNALFIAIEANCSNIVSLLIDIGYDVNIHYFANNGSARVLNTAIGCNNSTITELLIKKGADLNTATTGMGYGTPIKMAILVNNIDIIKMLFKYGVNKVNADDLASKETALDLAVRKDKKEIVELLKMNGVKTYEEIMPRRNSLTDAIEKVDIKTVKALINKTNVNEPDNIGDLPLNLAISSKNDELLDLVLSFEPDVNIKPKTGVTPLFTCVLANNSYAFDKILSNEKVEIDAKVSGGCTALFCAVICERLGFIEKLAAKGADIEVKPECFGGDTPLIEAVLQGKMESFRALLEKGADTNNKNNYGETPLHIAAKKGNTVAIGKLLDIKSTEIDSKNNDGQTALFYAVRFGQPEIVRELIKRNAAINIIAEGKTALDFSDDAEITGILIKSGAKKAEELIK